MAYIGSIPANQTTGARPRDEFTADGTQATFPLSQGVPGSFETNALVVVNNVVQQPVDSYTIINTQTLTLNSISGTFVLNETLTGATSGATGKVIKVNTGSLIIETTSGTFSNGETVSGGTSSASATATTVDQNFGGGLKFSETPEAASFIYVIHQGQATYNMIPAAGSVGVTQLDPVLRNFTVDEFTGDGSTVAFSLSDTPLTANSVLVVVDGIVQTRTTNYTVSGNTLTFTSAPDTSSEIQVIHLGFSAGIKTVPDNSIVTGKIANSAVTTAKINDSAVTTAKINDSAVTASKLASTLDLTGKTITLPADAVSVSGVAATTTTGASVLFKEGTDNGTNYVALKAPDSISTDITWTLPNIDGTNGQVLSTNGSGTLSFVTAGGSGSSITAGDSSVEVTDTGSDGTITFDTDGSERMRITNAGNVGIGTTSPSAALHIAGTSSLSSEFKVGDLTWNNNGNGGVVVQYRGSDDYTELQINNPVSGASVFTVRDGSGANIAFYQDGTGKFAKTIGVGNATPAASGAGISFPATQSASSDANTLDDYEEGSFTLTLDGTTAISYANRVGRYTKIGRIVQAQVLLQASGITFASSGATLTISGLPFAGNFPGYQGGEGSAWFNQITYSGQLTLVVTGSTLQIRQTNSGGSSSMKINNDVVGGSIIVHGTITYMV